LALVAPALELAAARALIDKDPAVIRPTTLGQRFLNDLQALFLVDRRESASAAPLVRRDPVRDGH